MFVNDAFGTAHRAHSSTEGVTKHVKESVAGLLLQKELDYLGESWWSLGGQSMAGGSAHMFDGVIPHGFWDELPDFAAVSRQQNALHENTAREAHQQRHHGLNVDHLH